MPTYNAVRGSGKSLDVRARSVRPVCPKCGSCKVLQSLSIVFVQTSIKSGLGMRTSSSGPGRPEVIWWRPKRIRDAANQVEPQVD